MRAATTEAGIPARVRVVRAAGWLVARLPQRALPASGAALAWLSRPLLRRRARIAATNLALCFPHLSTRERARLREATLRAAVVGVLECLRAWYAPPRRIHALYSIEGLEHLQAARARGRGTVVLAAHFTPVELMLRLLSDAMQHDGMGALTVMKRPHNDRALEVEIDRRRRMHCGPTIDKNDAHTLLGALAGGAVVAYAADQDFNFHHVFVPFFGVPAATVTAPATLARRSGAAVLPIWFRRGRDGRYVLRIEPQWPGYPSSDRHADAARYMRAIEEQVRVVPEQYLWVHRRFKTRPPGHPPLY